MQSDPKTNKAAKAPKQALLTWKEAALAIALSVALASVALLADRGGYSGREPRGATVQKTHPPGFTLIELSIVLVIIGLIVGGVLVGQELISQAAMRALTTQAQQWSTAVNTFEVKYGCLPGDCLNATEFFGTDSNGCDFGGGATGTCNGDGNGLLQNTDVYYGENFRFWQQLAQANLVPGSFTGVYDPAGLGGYFTLDRNVPHVNGFSGAFAWPYYWDIQSFMRVGSDSGPDYGGGRANVMSIGYADSFLTAKQAFLIDTKIDDGLPGEGHMLGSNVATDCVNGSNPATATYNTAGTGVVCSLGWIFQ